MSHSISIRACKPLEQLHQAVGGNPHAAVVPAPKDKFLKGSSRVFLPPLHSGAQRAASSPPADFKPGIQPLSPELQFLISVALFDINGPLYGQVVSAPEFHAFLEQQGTTLTKHLGGRRKTQLAAAISFAKSYVAAHGTEDSLVRALAREAAKQCTESEAFRTQLTPLSGHSVVPPHLPQQLSLVSSFVGQILDSAQDEIRMPPVRARSLARALRQHGSVCPADDGYRVLERLSYKNAAWLLAGTPSISRLERLLEPQALQQISAAVGDLECLYIHNTNYLKGIPLHPLLSSRQLERLAGIGGANTRVFNSRFLASDDNLFFWVKFGNSVGTPVNRPSEYGLASLTVEPRFAQTQGWISAYMMNPEDLQQASEVLNLPFQPLGPPIDPEHDVPGGSWLQARERLHRLDFTPGDFERLVRVQLTASLMTLALQDPRALKDALNGLAGTDPSQVEAVIHRYVLEPLGLPDYLEFKVPVSVPPHALRVL